MFASLNNSKVGTVLSIPRIAPTVVVWPNVVLPIVIKLSVPPPWIVTAFELPTVIFSLVESNNKFVDLISSESIVNPPISPEVAVILPVIWASEAVIWPLDFKISLSFELEIAAWVKPKPAISPVPVTIISPFNKALEAVIWPLFFKTKLLFELDIAVVVIPKPAIVPVPTTFNSPSILVFPLKRALEPVISPLCFMLKLELDKNMNRGWWPPPNAGLPLRKRLLLWSWKDELSVTKPPIKAALAVIVPSNFAPLAINTPSLFTIKLGPILIKKLDEFEPVGVKSI